MSRHTSALRPPVRPQDQRFQRDLERQRRRARLEAKTVRTGRKSAA